MKEKEKSFYYSTTAHKSQNNANISIQEYSLTLRLVTEKTQNHLHLFNVDSQLLCDPES